MITVIAANIIDGFSDEPLGPGAVHIDGERIIAVTGPESAGRSGEVVDLAGLTLMPGLIDAHSHLGLLHPGGDAHFESAAVSAAQIFWNCALALDEGFTTVRDLGGLDGGVADSVARGLVPGPRILPSGAVLAQSGGHLDHSSPWRDPLCGGPPESPGWAGLTTPVLVCDGVAEATRAARTLLRRGATQIKVAISGGVISYSDSLTDTQFSQPELAAIVAEAVARGTYVCAHAHNNDAIRLGLSAGVSCFEHVSFLDEETAADVRAASAAIVPTLTTVFRLVDEWQAWNVPEQMVPRMAGVRESMCDAVRMAHKSGLTIGSGSDILGPDQRRRGLEIKLKADLIGPMAAIQSATSVNASILRRSDDIGTLRPGRYADLIAVDGDPLERPELFGDPSRVVFVMRGGHIVKDPRRPESGASGHRLLVERQTIEVG